MQTASRQIIIGVGLILGALLPLSAQSALPTPETTTKDLWYEWPDENALAVAPLTHPDDWYSLAYKHLAKPSSSTTKPKSNPLSVHHILLALQVKEDGLTVFGDPKTDIVWFVWKKDESLVKVEIKIYDIIGEPITTLIQTGPLNSLGWNIHDMLGGIFYYQLSFWRTGNPPLIWPLKKLVVFH